jgi:hypothetical protein
MIERLSGKKQEDLQCPDLPFHSDYLVQIFFDVSSTRNVTANGNYLPINYTEMKSYCDLMKVELDASEVGLIKALDFAYLDAIQKEKEADTPL